MVLSCSALQSQAPVDCDATIVTGSALQHVGLHELLTQPVNKVCEGPKHATISQMLANAFDIRQEHRRNLPLPRIEHPGDLQACQLLQPCRS